MSVLSKILALLAAFDATHIRKAAHLFNVLLDWYEVPLQMELQEPIELSEADTANVAKIRETLLGANDDCGQDEVQTLRVFDMSRVHKLARFLGATGLGESLIKLLEKKLPA